MTSAERISQIDTAIAKLKDNMLMTELNVSKSRALSGLKKVRALTARSASGFSDKALETLVHTIRIVYDKDIKQVLRDLYNTIY